MLCGSLFCASILAGKHDDPVLAVPAGKKLDLAQWKVGVLNFLADVLVAIAVFIDHDGTAVLNFQADQHKPVLRADFIQMAGSGIHEPISPCCVGQVLDAVGQQTSACEWVVA